jgi:hypothetical protein
MVARAAVKITTGTPSFGLREARKVVAILEDPSKENFVMSNNTIRSLRHE